MKKIYLFSMIFTLIFTSSNTQAFSSELVSNPARTVDWTCHDNSFLPNGKSEVGVSYEISPEKFLASKIGTLQVTSSIQANTKNSQSTISFDQVIVDLEKGDWKYFYFIAAIGHTAVIVKKFPVKSTHYVQKLGLKYTNTTSKINKLELSSYFEAKINPKDPINKTSCGTTTNFERFSTPHTDQIQK